MKQIKLLILVLLVGGLNAQQIEEPNYGLAVTGTGMTVCMIGTTMNQTTQIQYNPKYGSNYVSNHSQDSRTLRLSTMAVGAIITLVGIAIQNKKRKNKSTIKI